MIKNYVFSVIKSHINIINSLNMKKISHSDCISLNQVSMCDSLNPEQNETKCKICFEEKMPLVTLCQCTGSIGYVHQQCILDWIALKMEKSQLIEIPRCEICKARFSAVLKMGKKKIDHQLLAQKIKVTSKKQLLILAASLISSIVAFITIFMSVFYLIFGESLKFQTIGIFALTATKFMFIEVMFPAVFLNERFKYFKGKWKIVDSCRVQLVQVTLKPKKILSA